MAIMIKDMNGVEQRVASNAKGNAGLTLGIIGTALAALGGGGIDLLGNGNNKCGCNPCVVTEKDFYERELDNRDREFRNFQLLQNQICDLAQRVSVNETANAYQNILTEKEFENVERELGWDRIATGYEIKAATCKKIDGVLGLPISSLTNGFQTNDNYLFTYSNNGCCNNGSPFGGWYY